MPPKKDAKEPQDIIALLGRAKNSLSMGIVGLPNIGKSLTFSILTQVQVPSENYPFCTIDPNHACVAVPDVRYDWLCQYFKPKSCVPTYLDCFDIAGLIKGASEGQGLGNAFLSNIKSCDGLFHIIRVFEEQEIVHVDGDVDPIRDLETIETELIAKDLQIVDKLVSDTDAKIKRGLSGNDKHLVDLLPIYQKIQKLLNERQNLFIAEWNVKEIKVLNELQLLTGKPVVYLVNMSEKDFIRQKNKWLVKISDHIKKKYPNASIIPYSATLEHKLLKYKTKEEKAEYLKSLGEGVTSRLDKIIKTGYKELNLVHFFTCGTDEVRCWTIRKYTSAPDAAGVIHTDFHDFFICAEVYKYDDLKELGSEHEVQAAGKLKTEGKNYIVQDGDVMFFKHNAKGGSSKKK